MRGAATSLRVRQWLQPLLHLVRWREWHDSKLPLYLVGMCYAVLRQDDPGAAQLGQIAALVVMLSCYAAFGHIVNDYADRDADRAAGKARLLATWSETAALAAVVLPGIATIGIGFACFDRVTAAVTLIAVLVAALYSLPPARLKERGVFGWAAATLAQRTVPLAIVFQALAGWDWVAAGLCGLGTVIGVRFIIVHQLHDRDNDRRSGVRTVATEHDPRSLVALVRGLFALEVACLCAVVAAMAFVAPLVGVAALAYAASLVLSSRRGRPVVPVSYFVLHGFYAVVWPVTIALVLAVHRPFFVPVLILAGALSWREGRQRFRATFGTPKPAPPPGAQRSENRAHEIRLDPADPYPAYARFRATAPVLGLDWPGLGRGWYVTRHREALALFKDPRFTRNPDSVGAPEGASGPMRGFGRDMVELDPPDHTRLRKLVGKAFTQHMVERFDARIGGLADQILDRAIERGGIELISEYAAVIPLTIISELLGVPVGDAGKFRSFLYSLTLGQPLGGMNPTRDANTERFTRHLEAIFAARRQTPRDDLVSALVVAEQDGESLSPDELMGMVYLLLLGGFVTTVNLIGNGMLALLRHPEQLDRLRRNPDLADSAVDELLRFDAPVVLSPICYASSDLEFAGQAIPKGAPVRAILASANRDEDQFAAADTLDIARNPCPHLSFGQGIHYCLGAPLARLEGKIALRRLVERLPAVQVADPRDVKWRSHPMLRGLQQLSLRF